jgi:hypothetical protein
VTVKLEVDLPVDKAIAGLNRVADKFDQVGEAADKVADKQESASKKGARAAEREAVKQSRAQEREAQRATRGVEREADKQARAAERAALRETRAAERAARTKQRVQEKETRDVQRAIEKFNLRRSRNETRRLELQRKENERNAKAIEKANLKAGTSAGDMFKGALAANFATKLAGMAVSAAKLAVSMGAAREQQTFWLNATGQGKFAGAEYLDHADALAERFGLTIDETRVRYQKLLSLKQTPEAIDKLIRLGADLKHSGKSEGQIDEIYDAINQVAIKEKGGFNDIGTEAISRLGVTHTDILAGLAKELGQKTATEEDLVKFFGKTGAESSRVVNLLQNAVQNSLGVENAGDIAAKYADTTLSGQAAQAEAKATQLGERWSQGFLAGFAPGIEKARNLLLDISGEDAEKAGAGFADFLTPLWLKPLLDPEGAKKLQDRGVVGAAEDNWAAIGLGGPQSRLYDDSRTDAADRAAAQAARAEASFFGGSVGTNAARPESAYEEQNALGSPEKKAADKTVRFREIGKQYAAGVVSGIAEGSPAVEEAGAALGEVAAKGTEDALEIRSPSRRGMRTGRYYGQGLAIGQADALPDVQAATDKLADAMQVPDPAGGAANGGAEVSPVANIAAGGSAGGSGVTIEAPITITVVAGEGATPEQVGQRLRRDLRREVENMMAEAAIQLGG